jgi:amino acid permease
VESSGKHAGKRRAEPAPKPPKAPASEGDESSGRSWAKLLPLALGVTLCVVAWGYLVYAAIDFGATARGGETRAWWFLAMASLGAVVCLFAGLLLVARLMRLVGVTKTEDAEPPPPRPIGGKRAAR